MPQPACLFEPFDVLETWQLVVLGAIICIPQNIALCLKVFAKDVFATNPQLRFWGDIANGVLLCFAAEHTAQGLLRHMNWTSRANEIFWREVVSIVTMWVCLIVVLLRREF